MWQDCDCDACQALRRLLTGISDLEGARSQRKIMIFGAVMRNLQKTKEVYDDDDDCWFV